MPGQPKTRAKRAAAAAAAARQRPPAAPAPDPVAVRLQGTGAPWQDPRSTLRLILAASARADLSFADAWRVALVVALAFTPEDVARTVHAELAAEQDTWATAYARAKAPVAA